MEKMKLRIQGFLIAAVYFFESVGVYICLNSDATIALQVVVAFMGVALTIVTLMAIVRFIIWLID